MLDSPSPSARSDEEPLRVLLIEDNPHDAQLFRDYLQEGRRPMEIRWKQDLSAGLQALREQPIDVVVLDLGLPDSQGVDTVRRFADAAPSVPVVVLTGAQTLETALAAQQAGATEYLRKEELTPSLAERTLRWAAERARMERTLRQA
jgi:DNA-binding response OmpR family regulator